MAQALRDAASSLEAASDTARLDAELLMAAALGVTRSELLLRHMADAPPPGFAGLLARRQAQEPVAYIIGRQEFYGRVFAVSPAVLIPRADSECVVQAALDACADWPAGPRRVLDCGVGSGALLLTLLAERPEAQGIGIDRSAAAAEVARTNAEALGLRKRAQILKRDWNDAHWREGLGGFDLVLANPPYVEDNAQLAPSVRGFEPAQALFAGVEGLDDYRILLPQLAELLWENGLIVLEIGTNQADAVREIARSAGFVSELRKDLGGRPRALILRLGLGKGD